MAQKPKTKSLGRGLSALLAEADPEPTTSGESQPSKGVATLPIEKIQPNPEQPRRDFVQSDLDELAASIKEKGVIQPLIVRIDPDADGMYQIVAGERRWRAAQLAQLHELPVLVRELNDVEVLELAIIENIQRADLNAIEEAMGYRQLMDAFGHTQEQMATALGKSRSHIANLLRLLTLPDDVLAHVREGKLSAGHARTLVSAEDPSSLAGLILSKGLSVRQAEALAKTGNTTAKQSSSVTEKDADTRAIESDLKAQLKMNVKIDQTPGAESGKVTIKYKDLEQLDKLLQILSS